MKVVVEVTDNLFRDIDKNTTFSILFNFNKIVIATGIVKAIKHFSTD